MRELTELLERVEKATGPDREIDAALALLVAGWTGGPGRAFWTDNNGRHRNRPPAYTASIDAALALVERKLPGWAWFVDWIGMPDQPACHAEVWLPSIRTKLLGRERERGEAATPALAIIAALLRALQAEGGER